MFSEKIFLKEVVHQPPMLCAAFSVRDSNFNCFYRLEFLQASDSLPL